MKNKVLTTAILFMSICFVVHVAGQSQMGAVRDGITIDHKKMNSYLRDAELFPNNTTIEKGRADVAPYACDMVLVKVKGQFSAKFMGWPGIVSEVIVHAWFTDAPGLKMFETESDPEADGLAYIHTLEVMEICSKTLTPWFKDRLDHWKRTDGKYHEVYTEDDAVSTLDVGIGLKRNHQDYYY